MIAEIINGSLIQKQSLLEALDMMKVSAPRIAAAGAGGKTTVLKRLAAEYKEKGLKPIVTTTTHMFREDSALFLEEPSVEEILTLLDKEGCAFAGGKAKNGKIKILSANVLDAVLKLPNPVLVEADGARRFPAKFPADHEPVLLPQTTHVLYLYGMDAPGQKIKDVCFRPELTADFLKKSSEDLLMPQDIAMLAQNGRAGRKGVEAGMHYAVILNKADTLHRRNAALEIWRSMDHETETKVLVTSEILLGKSMFHL